MTQVNQHNNMRLPDGKTRLDLVREGLTDSGLKKRGRLVVSIEKLREDPRNERRTFRNMEGLIESIRAVGLIEPITVSPGEGETYQIITGHRRYRAAKAAALIQVEVLIREPDDELTRRQKSIISNVQREDVGPVEMAEALQSLMDEDPRIKTQDDLARTIGKDKTWVSGMLRILALPIDVHQKVGFTQLSLSYDSMIRIARLDSPSQQVELADALLSGANQREIRDRIDAIKGKPKSKDASTSTKPKRVYHTAHKATVIVQSETQHLTSERVIAALEEALRSAAK
jgi:ParB family chromosome partitioning protein